MTDRQGFDDLREIEDRLRGALTREALSVRPDDRLGDIRAAVTPAPRRWRWVTPLAVAAAVAAIAVVAWIGLRPAAPPPVPATPSPTGSATASETPTSSPTASAPSTTTAPAPTTTVALPVYYVAPPAAPGGKYGLVREFVPSRTPDGATMAQKADAALNAAVTVPGLNPNRFVAAWPAGTIARYVNLPAPELGVQVSRPGVTGLPNEVQQLAVQALVWTVTAVAQQAGAPVPVSVASGGSIFESVPAAVFKRPGAERAFEEIAPIWVDGPYAGQRLDSRSSVTVTGQACTFEAAVAWELRQGGDVVRKGNTTASSGCPMQGSWSVDLGVLQAGAYEFRALEYSAKDGSIAAQNIVPFSVG